MSTVGSDYADREGVISFRSENEYDRLRMDHFKNKFECVAISTPPEQNWSTF